MDHHLVPLSRRAGIEPVVEGRLREQGQRVRLLLGHGRGLHGRVSRVGDRLLAASPLIQRLARRLQRPQEQGPHLRRQPPPEHHRAVLVRIHLERPAGVLPRGLPGLGLPVHPPPAPHDPLDVGGRPGPPHRQQPCLGRRRGHPGQRPDLGVRELAAGERLGQRGQRSQGARHPDLLPGRPQIEPHPPAEPLGAGAKAGVPASPGVEGPDQVEEAGGGGLQVRRQLGDLVAEPVQFARRAPAWRRSSGEWISMASPPSAGATLHPVFGATWERPGRAIPGRGMIFGPLPPGRASPAPGGPLGRHPPGVADRRPFHAGEAVK